MNMKYLVIAIISVLVIVFIAGCNPPPASPTNTEPDWIEENGLFYTYSIAKAQQYVPFRIILPNNILEKPIIQGTLNNTDNSDYYSLTTQYVLPLENKNNGHISVFQTNQPSLPDDPKNELLTIDGVDVVKWEVNHALGPGYTFFFNNNMVYFIVELYGVSNEYSIALVESIIKQL